MNPERRKLVRKLAKKIQEGYDCIDSACELIDVIYAEESDSLDNIPEQLINSVRYERAENGVYLLDSFMTHLEDVKDAIAELQDEMAEVRKL